MKPCEQRWREELVAHILGSPASHALAAHLEQCPVCRQVFREWKARMGRIDTGIRQLAASEPSARIAFRVMAESPAQHQRGWLSPGWSWIAATLSAGIIVIASSLYLWKAQGQHAETGRVLSAASVIGRWRSPTDGLLRFPSDRWVNTMPRLGEHFYQLNRDVPGKE